MSDNAHVQTSLKIFRLEGIGYRGSQSDGGRDPNVAVQQLYRTHSCEIRGMRMNSRILTDSCNSSFVISNNLFSGLWREFETVRQVSSSTAEGACSGAPDPMRATVTVMLACLCAW